MREAPRCRVSPRVISDRPEFFDFTSAEMFSDNGMVWVNEQEESQDDAGMGNVASLLSPDLFAALGSMSEFLNTLNYGHKSSAKPKHPFDEITSPDYHSPTTAATSPSDGTNDSPNNLAYLMPMDLLFISDEKDTNRFLFV